jgi:hypothetical protein
LPAVDRQPERADQHNTHGHHNENDSLSVFPPEINGVFQNTMIPSAALPRRNALEK